MINKFAVSFIVAVIRIFVRLLVRQNILIKNGKILLTRVILIS